MIKYLSFLLIFYFLLIQVNAFAKEANCNNIKNITMKLVRKGCLNTPKSINKYIKKLKTQKKKLKKNSNCDVELLISLIDKKIKTLIKEKVSSPKFIGDCSTCSSIDKCRVACNNWHTEFDRYKNRINEIQFFENLDCDSCLRHLTQKYKKKGTDKKNVILSIDDIWALYTISQDKQCFAKSQLLIQKIMLSNSNFSTLGDMLIDRIEQGKKQKETNLKENEKLMKFSSDFFSMIASKDDFLMWKHLYNSLKDKSSANRLLLVKLLPSFKQKKFNMLIDEIRDISKSKGIVQLHFIKSMTRPDVNDREFMKLIHRQFIELTQKTYGLSPVFKQGDSYLKEGFWEMSIGDKTSSQNRTIDDQNLKYKIYGKVNKDNRTYTVMVKYLSKNDVLIFEDTVKIGTKYSQEKVNKKLSNIFNNFHDFLSTINALPMNKSEIILRDTDFDELETLINKSLYEDQRLFDLTKNLDSIRGICISDNAFWKGEIGEKAFGNNMKELIYEELRNKYTFENIHALILDTPPDRNYLSVVGKCVENIKYTEEGPIQAKITISMIINDHKKEKIYSETDLYVPQAQFIENPESIKMILIKKISYAIANYLQLIPETQRQIFAESTINPITRYHYLNSFFIPGYYISKYEKPPKWLKKWSYWNYSNSFLLGISILSEAIYINSNYSEDKEVFYWSGVIGTGLFLANGALGIFSDSKYVKYEKKFYKRDTGLIDVHKKINRGLSVQFLPEKKASMILFSKQF